MANWQLYVGVFDQIASSCAPGHVSCEPSYPWLSRAMVVMIPGPLGGTPGRPQEGTLDKPESGCNMSILMLAQRVAAAFSSRKADD